MKNDQLIITLNFIQNMQNQLTLTYLIDCLLIFFVNDIRNLENNLML